MWCEFLINGGGIFKLLALGAGVKNSFVKHLPYMHEILGSVSSTAMSPILPTLPPAKTKQNKTKMTIPDRGTNSAFQNWLSCRRCELCKIQISREKITPSSGDSGVLG